MKHHYIKYQYFKIASVPVLPGLHRQHTLSCSGKFTITDVTPLYPVVH